MANVLPMRTITLDRNNLPAKHWAGRTKMARFLREWVNEHTGGHITEPEATDLAEEAAREYMGEQR